MGMLPHEQLDEHSRLERLRSITAQCGPFSFIVHRSTPAVFTAMRKLDPAFFYWAVPGRLILTTEELKGLCRRNGFSLIIRVRSHTSRKADDVIRLL
jgi:hypothetical protein